MIEILDMRPDNRDELRETIDYFAVRRLDAYSGEKRYYDIAIDALKEKAGED